MTAQSPIIIAAATRLEAAGVPSTLSDARLLWEHADQDVQEFQRLLDLRLKRIPLQHIMGVAYFRHLELKVGPGVFTPRPETELLAQVAIDELNGVPPAERIAVDLCSGSGAVAFAIATEVPQCQVHAVEISPEAFSFLTANLEKLQSTLNEIGSTVSIYQADACDRQLLQHVFGQAAVVVSNPPYIPDDMIPREPEVLNYDPKIALFGGHDGLVVAREVVHHAADLLVSDGLFGMEHADVQGESVLELFDQQWYEVRDHLDYNQLPRFVTARRAKG